MNPPASSAQRGDTLHTETPHGDTPHNNAPHNNAAHNDAAVLLPPALRAPPADSIASLNQQITLRLQTIDANLGACFRTVTQDIIPRVRGYAAVCDGVLDSAATLAALFQEAGQTQLALGGGGGEDVPQGSTPPRAAPATAAAAPATAAPASPTVTSTGRVLRLPDSSDEEDGAADGAADATATMHTATAHTGGAPPGDGSTSATPGDGSTSATPGDGSTSATPGDDSTLQRASRKRKASLLLRREYASSSPVGRGASRDRSPRRSGTATADDTADDTAELLHLDG